MKKETSKIKNKKSPEYYAHKYRKNRSAIISLIENGLGKGNLQRGLSALYSDLTKEIADIKYKDAEQFLDEMYELTSSTKYKLPLIEVYDAYASYAYENDFAITLTKSKFKELLKIKGVTVKPGSYNIMMLYGIKNKGELDNTIISDASHLIKRIDSTLKELGGGKPSQGLKLYLSSTNGKLSDTDQIFDEFVSNNIIIDEDADNQELSEIYTLYMNYALEWGDGRLLTKLCFRRLMELEGASYGQGTSNVTVFYNVKTKDETEEEEL